MLINFINKKIKNNMEDEIKNINDKIILNNNIILLEIINELKNIIQKLKDNSKIKILEGILPKINKIIEDNKKIIDIMALKINNVKIQEKEFENGKYIGQLINGLREGKGTYFYMMVVYIKENGKTI